MSRARGVVGAVAACVLLAGCGTTVPGVPAADPSGLIASLDTGSFPTAPRTVSAPTAEVARMLEADRLADTAPFLNDIDPALRYHGKLYVGTAKEIGLPLTISGRLSDAAGDFELGFVTSADSARPGATRAWNDYPASMAAAVLRMGSADAAAKVVASPELGEAASSTSPTPTPASVPGFPAARAYGTLWEYKHTTSYLAAVADGDYVIAVYADDLRTVADYFTRQIAGLRGFRATPLGELASLPPDSGGVVRLTLPDDTSIWSTPHTEAARGDDIAASRAAFTDTGADTVGDGASTVYRARDAASATTLQRTWVEMYERLHPDATVPAVRLAPGARCFTYPENPGATDTKTSCWVAVGRYVAEYDDTQAPRAAQAINASYLILKRA